MGGTHGEVCTKKGIKVYIKESGDYDIPGLILDEEAEQDVFYGRYGDLRRDYLQEHKPKLWMVLVNSSKLDDHLKGVGRMAEQRMDTLLPQLMKAAGVTGELKVCDRMAWVGLVNNLGRGPMRSSLSIWFMFEGAVLIFEKVMEVFKDYLTGDTRYEIVMTSHGYTVPEWDSSANTWAGEEVCASPGIMRDALPDCFTGYLEYKKIENSILSPHCCVTLCRRRCANGNFTNR